MARKHSRYKEKRPYKYTFPRCAHMRDGQPATHVESFSVMAESPFGDKLKTIAKVRVCDICNTMQGKAFHVRTYEQRATR